MDKLQRQHLSEIETAADEILVQRREIVNLDKKRQKTREAIRQVRLNIWFWGLHYRVINIERLYVDDHIKLSMSTHTNGVS